MPLLHARRGRRLPGRALRALSLRLPPPGDRAAGGLGLAASCQYLASSPSVLSHLAEQCPLLACPASVCCLSGLPGCLSAHPAACVCLSIYLPACQPTCQLYSCACLSTHLPALPILQVERILERVRRKPSFLAEAQAAVGVFERQAREAAAYVEQRLGELGGAPGRKLHW